MNYNTSSLIRSTTPMAQGGLDPAVSGNYADRTLKINAPFGTAPDGVPYATAQAAQAAQASAAAAVPDPGWGNVYQGMATSPALAQSIAAAMQQTGATVAPAASPTLQVPAQPTADPTLSAPRTTTPTATGGIVPPVPVATPSVSSSGGGTAAVNGATNSDPYGLGSGLNGAFSANGSTSQSPFGGQLNQQYGLQTRPNAAYQPPRSFIAPIRR